MSNHLPPPATPLGRGTSLTANARTPWVNVYELAQTIFCPRAGLLTHELGQSDDGQEGEVARAPRLDWLPDYDEALINEALQRIWGELAWVGKYGLGWLTLCAVIYYTYDRTLGIVLAVPSVLFIPWIWRQFCNIVELDRRRRAAASAECSLSMADLGQVECQVNWWALRKAGFSLTKPHAAHSDPAWKLAGKPFLILQHQSLRIPVVRKHRGKPELHTQNRARTVAYCHLIETTEGAQSPFGVFMFAGSYEVFIVPNSPSNRAAFHDGLRKTRQLLDDAAAGELPGEPIAGNPCLGCPHGKPLVYQRGRTDAHLSVLRGAYTPARGADRFIYHSVCGDRFEWCPPHEKASAKKLGKAKAPAG